MVGYNIWPNEVAIEIRKRGIPTIAGNDDQGIGLMSNDCGCAYKTEPEKDMGKISIGFNNEIMKEEERKYLRTLPSHINLEFQLNHDKLNLLLVHGSPRKINEYLFEDREEKSTIRILEQVNADILCFGHTHKPYHRIFNTGTEGKDFFRHAINIGSVGEPKDGDPRGGYVILTINDNTSINNKDSIKLKYMKFPKNLKYSKEHTWLSIDGDTGTVGITEFAQSELGEIVFVDLPATGKVLKQDEVFGSVEAVKTVSDLSMLVSGQIIETNSLLK